MPTILVAERASEQWQALKGLAPGRLPSRYALPSRRRRWEFAEFVMCTTLSKRVGGMLPLRRRGRRPKPGIGKIDGACCRCSTSLVRVKIDDV